MLARSRRLVTNKKWLVMVPVALALAVAVLFLPVREVSIDPYGRLSLESKITLSIGYEVAYAATTQALYPYTVATFNANLGGAEPDIDWDTDTPANVKIDDGVYAQIGELDKKIYSYRLDATDFRFTIPDGATIDGIVLEFERNNTKTDDALVQLIKGGTPQGTDKSAGATWLLNDTIATFGSSTDKWGLQWTVADINSDTFGVAVACIGNANNAVPQIDFLRITVHYTPSPDITNAPDTINFGTVYTSTDYWSKGSAPSSWPLDDAECTFTLTNLTEVAVDIDIRATHFSDGKALGGWDLGGTAGADVVVLKAGPSGETPTENDMVTLTTGDLPFIAALAGGSSTKMWELKMETPSSFSNADVKTATITLTATLSP